MVRLRSPFTRGNAGCELTLQPLVGDQTNDDVVRLADYRESGSAQVAAAA